MARRACLPGAAQDGVNTRRRGDFFLPCPWQASPHGRCVLILCCFCILFNPPCTKAVVQGYGDGDRSRGSAPSYSSPSTAGATSADEVARGRLCGSDTAAWASESWDLVTELFDFEHLRNRCLLTRQKE